MKGVEIVFPGKGYFELQNYEEKQLGKQEIRGKTLVSLVSQGTELAWANGDSFPIQPGYGAVFEVEEVGLEVTDIGPGDLRFCMGAHRSTQQYEARFTLAVPEGISAETAVFARLMGVSMTTLMTTLARPGDLVFVCGAGPVGFLAAHLFRISGYEVFVVEPDERRRIQIESTGITSTYASMPLEDQDLVQKIALVLDCSGHEKAILDACQMVRKRGEVVLVGVPWKQMADTTAHQILESVFFNYVVLRSGWEWEVPLLGRSFVWEELYEGYNNASYSTFSGFERALKWLSEGKIPLSGLVKSIVPTDPGIFYRAIMNKEISEPFIVLDWSKM